MLLIILKLSFISVAHWIIFLPSPSPIAIFLPLGEVALVDGAISPDVLAVAFELAMFVVADVDISIGEELTAFAIFEAALPFTFVPVTIPVDVHPIAFTLGVPPLSDVGVALDADPHSVAVLEALVPFTFVSLFTKPSVDAFPMRLSSMEVSFIGVAVLVEFVACAFS